MNKISIILTVLFPFICLSSMSQTHVDVAKKPEKTSESQVKTIAPFELPNLFNEKVENIKKKSKSQTNATIAQGNKKDTNTFFYETTYIVKIVDIKSSPYMGSISNAKKTEFVGSVDLIITDNKVFFFNINLPSDSYESLVELMNKTYGKSSVEYKSKTYIGTMMWNDSKNGISFVLGNGKGGNIMMTIIREDI